ncbi:MAG: zinc-ribbon domain-containing protein [Methanoregula sp.]
MKKCPHCGMNIRDNVEVCGYCGGTISDRAEKAQGTARGKADIPDRGAAQKTAKKPSRPAAEDTAGEDAEEEGGLSKVLEPGEQVLIGSLNISVKKFPFHAYLTDRRVFLIDTQEKKIKVTAKDIPRDTIVGSIVEVSENSDPVLVLSIKSIDDDIKTMKLVFTQNGMDRTSEVDDWVGLLQEQSEREKPQKRSSEKSSRRREVVDEEEPEDYEEPEEPVRTPKPAPPQELHPTRKPTKDHEKQPPVKRLLTTYQAPEPEEEYVEPEPVKPVRRTQFKAIDEPEKKAARPVTFVREIPSTGRAEPQPLRKTEVHSAMKNAMKSPLQPVRQPGVQPVRKPAVEPVRAPEPEEEPDSIIDFIPEKQPVRSHRPIAHEESAESPQFCHSCGKKLPTSANFCPGCGTKLGHPKSAPSPAQVPAHATNPRAADTNPHMKRLPKVEVIEDDDDIDAAPRKPPVKKVPKGSDMTILHKFLRR